MCGLAEGAQRVEDLVVHLRAGEGVVPRGGDDLRRHPRRVLVEQHVVAGVALGEQLLELVDDLLGRARLVLDVDAAVLERVDELAEGRDVAGLVDAVLGPGREVAAARGRVGLVVRGREGLLLVAAALVGRVGELAAGRVGRLLLVRDLDLRKLRAGAGRRLDLRLVVRQPPSPPPPASTAMTPPMTSTASRPPNSICRRLLREAALRSASSCSMRARRRASFSS